MLLEFLKGTYGVEDKVARERFNADHSHWKRNRWELKRREEQHARAVADFKRNLPEYEREQKSLQDDLEREIARYEVHVASTATQAAADAAAFGALISDASEGRAEAIEQLAILTCYATPLPMMLPQEPTASFDAEAGILLLNIHAPNAEEVGLYAQLKTKSRAATEKEVRQAQEFVVHALALRCLHEIFATPELSLIRMAGVNVSLAYTDRKTGKRRLEIIGSLAATRDEFANIDIAHVDPKLCFRALKGIASPSFDEVSAVRPLLSFGDADGRIVASREIVDELEQDTNLAALDWEDFEHIVRELFAKLFSARAKAEVHVTRASRDYGVDALIFDPDPIHGGKFVIQAKRYVNTVDVAAVRDLFGTVQNEGANRGFLVTTSSFGPEAHSFAKGKPLTLIDGPHLIQLLREHGYSFRIDLPEARRVLTGRN